MNMLTIIASVVILSSSLGSGIVVPDSAPADVAVLTNQVSSLQQTVAGLLTAENITNAYLKSLNNEIVSMKTEMRIREDEFLIVGGDLRKLKSDFALLQAQLNLTILDQISTDVKNTAKELHDHMNASSVVMQNIQSELTSVKDEVQNTSSGLTFALENIASLENEVSDVKNKSSVSNEELRNTSLSREAEIASTQQQVNMTLIDVHDIRGDLSVMQSQLQALTNASLDSEVLDLKHNISEMSTLLERSNDAVHNLTDALGE